MTASKLCTALLCSTALISGVASAQSAAPAPGEAERTSAATQPTGVAQPDAAKEAERPAGEIVVTGSRVISNGNNSPTPVTTVTYDTIQVAKPGTINESLNQLPIFAGSRGQTANPSATGGVGGGNGTAGQLNLRNVGVTRNLILFDGHRLPPTSFTGIVDMDMIPQNVLQRVDMVTGGVSAVYGSDAVTGVINFITDRKFNGLKAHTQVGISKYGDGEQFDADIAAGKDLFGGRGHILLSYEFRQDNGVDRKTARPYFQYQSAGGNGTSATPYYLITGARNSNSTFGGLFTSAPLTNMTFNTDGVLSPLNAGTVVGNGTIRVGGDGIYQDNNLKSPQKSHQVYGRFDFDFTDTIHGSLVGAGNFKKNRLYADFFNFAGQAISRSNAFLPTAVRNLIPATQASVNMSKTFLDYGYRLTWAPDTKQYYGAATLDGKLGSFDWDVAATYGRSHLVNTGYNNINREKLDAALDVVVGANGQPACFSASYRPDCVPLNPFGPTAYSQAALSYILGDKTTYDALTTMKDVSGSISGAPFSTWAGDVKVALSGEWRKTAFQASTNTPADLFADCTLIRFNCTATGAGRTIKYLNTFANRSKVTQSVSEGAFEVNVPLLKDSVVAKDLSVNGAARYTHYDTSGNYWSYKLGLDWHVNDDIKFRATRSRDIRAPNLFDIRASTFIVPQNLTDQLNGNVTVNNVPGFNYATPDLTAEIGKTTTAGVVLTPHFIPGLSLAVDWYHIKIDNAIQTIQGFNGRVQSACLAWVQSGGAPAANLACRLQSRDPSLAQGAGVYSGPGITPLSATYISNFNLGFIKTMGVDFEANYRTTLAGRAVRLRALASYQPHLYYNYGNLGLSQDDVAGYFTGGPAANLPTPKWRATVFAGYELLRRFNVDVMYRWRSGLGMDALQTTVWNYRIPSYGVFNLNLAYNVDAGRNKVEYFLNISNLFNKYPPLAPGTGTPGGFGGWSISDDWIGRYYTVGIRAKF